MSAFSWEPDETSVRHGSIREHNVTDKLHTICKCNGARNRQDVIKCIALSRTSERVRSENCSRYDLATATTVPARGNVPCGPPSRGYGNQNPWLWESNPVAMGINSRGYGNQNPWLREFLKGSIQTERGSHPIGISRGCWFRFPWLRVLVPVATGIETRSHGKCLWESNSATQGIQTRDYGEHVRKASATETRNAACTSVTRCHAVLSNH